MCRGPVPPQYQMNISRVYDLLLPLHPPAAFRLIPKAEPTVHHNLWGIKQKGRKFKKCEEEILQGKFFENRGDDDLEVFIEVDLTDGAKIESDHHW